MLRNYLTIAWRNLRKSKAHSIINISGLAIGMSVTMLIGFWLYDELTFDSFNPHYKRIAQVMQNQDFSGTTRTTKALPVPMGAELRKTYGSYFKNVAMASWCYNHVIAAGEKHLSRSGNFIEPAGPQVFGVTMIEGKADGLTDPTAILVSQSLAKALFGDADPLNKTVRMDDQANFTVVGVYADFPNNSTFHMNAADFLAPWEYYQRNLLAASTLTNWQDNSWQIFVQLADNADMVEVSRKIRDARLNKLGPNNRVAKPQLFLHPMDKWHLYSRFKNGIIIGGRIENIWLFGMIGIFVLLLACINFMNLSTARSEKRAKEVGIRKTVGSLRGQLIAQFFCESLLMSLVAFGFSLLLTWLALPFFNGVSGKSIAIPWERAAFWLACGVFVLVTGLVAGSYPALYLSSFRPIKVLKGTFKAGRLAAVPRQVLVVLQFSVSVVLIIGTIVVFKQIEFAKNRPVGYSREGLINMEMATDQLHQHFSAFRADALRSGMFTKLAESTSPATAINFNSGDVKWEGMDPNLNVDFSNIAVTSEYGRTVGWDFVAGRDLLPDWQTDSLSLIVNETAVQYMGMKDPIGKTVTFHSKPYRIIGVIRDVVQESPFEPVKQALYYLSNTAYDYVYLRINPTVSPHEAVAKLQALCKVYEPDEPFSYRFVDDAYAIKFAEEERVGKLASVFAVLAIFISCLGLFGMASFMAEQRIKEVGIRKVLGASVYSLWRLLSTDFVLLVGIALVIALPAAWYFMHNWLQHYTYRTPLGWWIFAAAGAGALLITLLTVSYQSIRAASADPVRSLRSE